MSDTTAWIAEIGLTRPNGTAETLFVTDTPVRPFASDDPDRPNQVYRSRLAGPPAYSVGTHADLSRLAGDVGAGQLELLNGDGAVSYLSGCAIGAVHVRMGREGQYWREWTPVLTGRAEAPQPTLSARSAGKVTLPLYDLRASLDSDVVDRTYGGGNVGAVGYDGTADAGKGDTVPLCIGRPANVPGKAVNTVSRTWQIDDGPIGGAGALYDRGDVANLSLVATSTPAATIGAWWSGAVRYRELVDLMARSEGAAVLPDALGRWQVARLDVPAAPIGSIGEGQILDIGVDDQDLAVPVWQVTVKGRRNHLVLDRSRIAGALYDTDREVWLKEEWRKAVAKADWVNARWGDDARAVEVDTALTDQSDMEALAARLLTLIPRIIARLRNIAGAYGLVISPSDTAPTISTNGGALNLSSATGEVWINGAPISTALKLPSVGTKAAAYTVTVADAGKLIPMTGSWTLSLPAAATAGNGFTVAYKNVGTGSITVDPYGTETVDGAAALVIGAGKSGFLVCDGAGWSTVGERTGTSTLVFDAVAHGSNVSIGFGGRVASCTVPNSGVARCNGLLPPGKWVWGMRPEAVASGVGVSLAAPALNSYLGADANGWSYDSFGNKVTNSGSTALGASYGVGAAINVYAEVTATQTLIWFAKDGVVQGGGDPVAGTSPAFTIASTAVYPAAGLSGGSVATLLAAATDLPYTPLSGFAPLP